MFGTFMGSTSSQAFTPDSGGSPLKTCNEVVSFYVIQMAIELLKRAISGSQLDTSYCKKGKKAILLIKQELADSDSDRVINVECFRKRRNQWL